jgi:VRR-NUC domain
MTHATAGLTRRAAGRPGPARSAPGPRLSEAEFMAQVVQVAELYGWRWAHFRPARTSKGWRTPASGPLGAGWPDLVLTRERDGRMALVELKVDDGRVSNDQSAVLEYLGGVARRHGWLYVGVWRPRDFDAIVAALT